MLGAIIGDIVGSVYEWNNIKTKDFELLTHKCFFTDDSVMTVAVADYLLDHKGAFDFQMSQGKYAEAYINSIDSTMRKYGRLYPNAGYGGMFRKWLKDPNMKPYNSFGNGAAMRISPVGWFAKSEQEVKEISRQVTECTHCHPEGIKGAEATAMAIFLARNGFSQLEIHDYITEHYYKLGFSLDSIRNEYSFNETCQETVPQALEAFFEATDFEDAIRNAISIGGDSDTLAAITGSIAEAYFGIPAHIRKHALTFLDKPMLDVIIRFENKFPSKLEDKKNGISVSFSATAHAPEHGTTRAEAIINAVSKIDEDLSNTKIDIVETTSKQLYNHLFEACNILRGPINQDEFKSYVIPLLFLKRISDVYDEEIADALEESGGDEEFAAFPENHVFVVPDNCHWDSLREKSKDVGKAIVDCMSGIEQANPDTLCGLFSSFDDADWTDKNKLSDERLKNLIEHMSSKKVGNKAYSADVMGDAYEILLKKFADMSKKNAGEFYTPRSIVGLMVTLLDPKDGDTIYDPACGTGGMLIEAMKHVQDKRMAYGKIFGQEINLSTSAIARMNLYLHGAREFKILRSDTLRNPSFIERGKLKTFNCVVANPPFGLAHWGSEQFSNDRYGRNIWGSPIDSNADYAWIQHMVCSMNVNDGRCAVVLPQGALFRGGKDGLIREKLIRSDKLECVISLAGGIFYSTGVSACVLYLNNNKRKAHRGKICLIDASQIYTAYRAQNVMEPDDINKVLSLYYNYKDEPDRCKIISIADAESKGFSLSCTNYIERTSQKTKEPSIVWKEFYEAYQNVVECEQSLKDLLTRGGYIDE